MITYRKLIGRVNKMTEQKKWEFINDELWILTFYGAFQHSNTYTEKSKTEDRKHFKKWIKEEVQFLVEKNYSNEKKKVDDDQHLKNIQKFCNDASKKWGFLLKDNKLRIGVGQKILNLYLKYLWSLDKIPPPPHCPIDRGIIKKAKYEEPVNWTELNDIKVYKQIIEKAKQEAKPKSLTEWELENFARN